MLTRGFSFTASVCAPASVAVIPSTAKPATPTITLRTDLFMLPMLPPLPRFADWSHVLDVDKNFIVGKLHVQLNCCRSPFTNGLHLFANIDPRGAGELGKSSERDSDSCVGRAPSGHDLLETL